jgi:hypothetical protein
MRLNDVWKSFFISLAYVGLGTICVLSVYPPFYRDWILVGLIITLPANFISFGIMYSNSTAYGTVLIVQLFSFFLFWFIVYGVLKIRSKKRP